MPTWLLPILNFLGQRFLHFVIYAAIGLSVWGVYYKLFVKETSKTVNQGEVKYYYQGAKVTTFGCAHFNEGKEGKLLPLPKK